MPTKSIQDIQKKIDPEVKRIQAEKRKASMQKFSQKMTTAGAKTGAVLSGAGRAVGKVAGGIFGTVWEGLAWQPEQEKHFVNHYQQRMR
jgi:hypothetical protein